MKKLLAVTLIVLLSIAALNAIDAHDWYFHIDDDEVGGPFGALLGMFFAGGGILLATLIVAAVGIFLCFLFAGLGVLVVVALALASLLVAALLAPLLLPVLIPLGILWYIVRRNRAKRVEALKAAAV
ncbi:hypothetical protein E7V67_023540 [[Empedobacter] haloabium]|uniref:Uncharacterized protein n=1 Tax=[Empedobacter] haloabium TaxID=592317 RepID=A0ABZ1UJA0_9BURK